MVAQTFEDDHDTMLVSLIPARPRFNAGCDDVTVLSLKYDQTK